MLWTPKTPAWRLGPVPASPARRTTSPNPGPPSLAPALSTAPGPRPRLMRATAHGVLALMATGVALQLALIFGDHGRLPEVPSQLAATEAGPAAPMPPPHTARLGLPQPADADDGHDSIIPAPVPQHRAIDAGMRASVALLLPRPELPPAIATPEAPAPAIADPATERLDRLRTKIRFQPNVRDDCLPDKLMGVIYELAEKFGDVRIASTHRDPRRNARVGGARHSLHLDCRAIDFMTSGKPRNVIEFLKNHADIGGYKRYPRGHYHIDNGPRRTW